MDRVEDTVFDVLSSLIDGESGPSVGSDSGPCIHFKPCRRNWIN